MLRFVVISCITVEDGPTVCPQIAAPPRDVAPRNLAGVNDI
jgi:hypothetical protein